MENREQATCTAFEGSRRIASGDLEHVALKTKEVLDRGEQAPVLIFDDETSEPIEVDFRGTPEQVLERLAESRDAPPTAEAAPRGPGRPRLGVVAREVTLLPNGEVEEGRLNIYLAVKDEEGGVSDLHQHPYPVRIPRDQLELARSQQIGYYATLEIRPGKPTVAVGVWDELSGTESFVQAQVLVGAAAGRGRRERSR